MSNTQGRRLSRRLALAAALAAAVLRQVSGAASIKTGAPEGQAGSAVNGVIPILGNAVQTTLLGQGGGLSLQLAPSAGVSQAPPVLPLPAAVLGANANANLAYLLQQTAPGPAFAQPAMPEALPAVKPAADASASALEAAGTKAPQPSAETALRQLKAAEQVLGRFEPGEFRKLPPAQLQAVLSELWDGVRHVSAEAQAPAGASEGNLQSGNRRAIRLERGGQAARFKNLLLEGVSPEMPQVAQGELRYWEPEEKAIETHVAGPHDSPALAAALAENEAAALRSIWARVAEGAALTPSVRAQADWLVAEAAREVIRQGRKGWALLGPALQASASDAAPDLQAAARALRESLLPALAEPDELVYLIEERQGSVTREELRRALIQREKDLVMDGIFDRILRFPYGFDVETPKEAQGQQVIAAARRSMMQSQWDDILAGIEQGLPARRAVAPVLDSLGKLVAQTEAKVLKNPTNSLMRNNLTVFQEIASAFSAIQADLRTRQRLYGPEDSSAERARRTDGEAARHRAAWAHASARFQAAPPDLRAFLERLGAEIESRIRRDGLPAQLAAADFFYRESEELIRQSNRLKEGQTGPIDVLMYYSHALRGGAEAAGPDRDLVAFAREIRDESDYAQLLLSLRRQGRVRAIVTPRLGPGREAAGRVPHWVIFAKAGGVVPIPFLDLSRAGIDAAALRERIASAGQPLSAVADGKRGQLLLEPDGPARAQWLQRGAAYHQLEDFYRTRALLPAAFEGQDVGLLADETDPAAFQDQGPGARIALSGARGVGLFRFEQFMQKLGVEWDPERLSAELGRMLAQPFFRGGAPLIVRLFDFEGDKVPAFLRKSLAPEQIAQLLETHANSRFYLDKSRPQLREFGKMQLKAVFAAHLRETSGRGVRLLFSNVRTAGEAAAIEELLEEARSEFAAERFGPSPAPDERARLDELRRIPVGYMVEEVATVEGIDELLREIASLRSRSPAERFLGIGTNDLTKSILQGDPQAVEKLSQLQPLLVRSIWRIGARAALYGIDVTVEGEWASSPRLTLALLALRVVAGLRVTQVAHTESIPQLYELIRAASRDALAASPREGIRESLLDLARAIVSGVLPGPAGLDRAALALAQKMEDAIAAGAPAAGRQPVR